MPPQIPRTARVCRQSGADGGAGDRGRRRRDAGGGVVLSAGAGYPALSALPRAALRLLSGGAARLRWSRSRPPGARRVRCCWLGLAILVLGRAGAMPGSAAITPASNGSSGRGRPIAPGRSAISAAPARLLQRLDSVKVIRCDEVQWRFLGLSLAGYNVLISLLMAAIAAWGFFAAKRS